jgi:hypothetical protein
MTLDRITIGQLEQIIYNIKRTIQNFLTNQFDEKTRANMHVQNKEDFALGLALGLITQNFYDHFILMYRRDPNQQEVLEATSIICSQISEIRYAIFKAG